MTTPNVNVPTNDKQKDADINQKTQLYGIYQGVLLPATSFTHAHGGPND